MPLAITPPERASAAQPATGMRLVVALTVLLVGWGALAFGAVYPWGYVPLAAGAAVVGAMGLALGRGLDPAHRKLAAALAAVALAATLQLIPLPTSTRTAVSPRLDPVLADLDLRFALERTSAEADGRTLLRPLTIDGVATRRGLLLFAAFSLLLLGLTAAIGRTGAHRLLPWLLVLSVLLAAVGIVQKLLLGDHAWGGMKIYGLWAPQYKLTTPFGPFVNKNHFAGWMLMALPLAVGYAIGLSHVGMRRVRPGLRNRLLWLSSPDGGRVQLAALAVAVMALALVMTKSRSGVGCFVVSMVMAAAWAMRHQASRATRFVTLALVSALVALPVLWGWTDLAQRFEAGRSDTSVQLRLDAWSKTASIIEDFPAVGTGLNTFAVAALAYAKPGLDHHFREAHNDYLQLAAEGGLLVVVPAAIAAALFAMAVRRRFLESTPESVAYWIRAGAVTGLAAIALQSTVEFSLQMPGNAVLCVVLAAIALHRSPHHATSDPVRHHVSSRTR
jgi:O-antigen ligase